MKALAILLLAVALRGQEVVDLTCLKPPCAVNSQTLEHRVAMDFITSDICGATITHPDADLVQVSCVDYDALRKYMPFLTTTGKETQVLIHARKGRNGGTIYVSVDGVNWRKGTQTLDAYGRLVTLITFPGVGYKTVEIDIP